MNEARFPTGENGLLMKRRFGEVPERLNGTVSKTVVGLVSTVGSNPTLPVVGPHPCPFSKERGVRVRGFWRGRIAGLVRTIGNRVGVTASRVRIPPSPLY